MKSIQVEEVIQRQCQGRMKNEIFTYATDIFSGIFSCENVAVISSKIPQCVVCGRSDLGDCR